MNKLFASLLVVLAFSAMACTKTVTVHDATAAPSPVSAQAQLDQKLSADPGLVDSICSETSHLRSVGWSDDMIPALLAGGKLPAMLDQFQLDKLKAIDMPTVDALTFAIERC